MPYIEEADRERAATEPRNVGELTFAIYRLMVRYVNVTTDKAPTRTDVHYSDHAEAIAAAEGAKAEYQRRILAPFEDWKRDKNGDIYGDR